jgi:uncharacterized protein (TIGR03435 family)
MRHLSGKVLLVVTTIAVAVMPLAAQAPTLKPSFEVGSIKPNNSGSRSTRVSINKGGRFTATNVPVKALMIVAYKLQEYQIIGGPPWLESDRYDITAKSEDDANENQVGEMIKSLLGDRFKLTFHHETRELPVYALLVSKNRPKLKASDGDNHNANTTRGKITGRAMPLQTFVILLSNQLDRLVVDKTGLTGNFDLQLEWSPEFSRPGALTEAGGTSSELSGPSIFTALQEQLGLRLESTKGPVEVLVIDSVQKPSEN